MQANDWDRESTAQLKSATKAADKRTKKLERELLRKEKALVEAAALLVLRGKLDAPVYERHCPEHTLLYQLVEQHYPGSRIRPETDPSC